LARDYGLSPSTISDKAKRYNWIGLAEVISDKTEQRIAEKLIAQKSDLGLKVYHAVDMLVGKITEGIKVVDKRDSTKIRAYMAALKDAKDMGFYRSDMDTAEQLARIKKLEKEASTEAQDNTITVVLSDEVSEYAD